MSYVSSALSWLSHPVTEDGHGYILRSPAGAEVELSDAERRQIVCADSKLSRIEMICRRHASPASNPGAHALAAAIVKICEEK